MEAVAKNMGVSMDTSFLSGANATFIAEMHRAWADNPANVDSQWAEWFSGLGALSNDIESVPAGVQVRPKLLEQMTLKHQ